MTDAETVNLAAAIYAQRVGRIDRTMSDREADLKARESFAVAEVFRKRADQLAWHQGPTEVRREAES